MILKLYSKNETDFLHNGLCILRPISALVTEELNGAFSLIVTMPKGSVEIQTEQIIRCHTPTTDQIFRVFGSDIDALGNQIFDVLSGVYNIICFPSITCVDFCADMFDALRKALKI